LSNLAGVYFALGDYAQAKLFYERALALMKPRTIRACRVVNDLNNWRKPTARLVTARGQSPSTGGRLQALKPFSHRIIPPLHPSLTISRSSIPVRTYEKAESLFERALAIIPRRMDRRTPAAQPFSITWPGSTMPFGNYDDAQSLYEQALSLMRSYSGRSIRALPYA